MKSEELNKLLNLYREQKLAHAYLIETNNLNLAKNDLIELVSNIFFESFIDKSISLENIKEQMSNRNYPDFIIVETDGKTIKKDEIEFLKQKCMTTSVVSKLKIYVIISPEKMNSTSFNKMLKFLEEPEDNIIGFYVSTSKQNIATTLLSRLENIRLIYTKENLQESRVEENTLEFSEIVYNFVNKLSTDNMICYNNTKLKEYIQTREDAVIFLKMILEIENSSLKNNPQDFNRILKRMKIINKYIDELNYNVNLGLMLNSFVLEMGEISD